MRAIDLYSGIGGWALGLKSSGIEVVASYEWWQAAALNHQVNLGETTIVADIRKLRLKDLPTDIDIVVGSPPCTQFSYANRGGSGDLDEGLIDIKKFLTIVEYLKPKFWAMENVPRTAKILEKELKVGGKLERFQNLFRNAKIEIINCEDFGLPQRRKRCIAGNFDFSLLKKYAAKSEPITLGNVIDAFSTNPIHDPNYDIVISKDQLSEHQKEVSFSDEETRINRSAKNYHPIYNDMNFPDSFDRSARTVTATCTRVSRESIVIDDPLVPGTFRRLTVRERATLQGFPINYQFHARSNGAKIKMVGNAVPPVLTYYISQCFLKTPVSKLISHTQLGHSFLDELKAGQITKPDTKGKTYPRGRSFRFAIPGLRFKSGTRFELNNLNSDNVFESYFYFGNSKRIKFIKPGEDILSILLVKIKDVDQNLSSQINETLRKSFLKLDHTDIQSTWTRKSTNLHPFEVLDLLGSVNEIIDDYLNDFTESMFSNVVDIFFHEYEDTISTKKLYKHAKDITSGMLVTSYYNSVNS